MRTINGGASDAAEKWLRSCNSCTPSVDARGKQENLQPLFFGGRKTQVVEESCKTLASLPDIQSLHSATHKSLNSLRFCLRVVIYIYINTEGLLLTSRFTSPLLSSGALRNFKRIAETIFFSLPFILFSKMCPSKPSKCNAPIEAEFPDGENTKMKRQQKHSTTTRSDLFHRFDPRGCFEKAGVEAITDYSPCYMFEGLPVQTHTHTHTKVYPDTAGVWRPGPQSPPSQYSDSDQ